MGISIGGLAGQYGLNQQDQDQAASRVGALQQPAPTNADVRQATAQQPSTGGWEQTQKYMGAAQSLSQDDGQQKNGLGKVLGLVGLFA